jgi:hypothetical protein
VLADPVVVEQTVTVAEVDLLGNGVHWGHCTKSGDNRGTTV